MAHPDSIKCFGLKPGADISDTYDKVAIAVASAGMKAEFSAGLATNYGLAEVGPAPPLLEAFRRHRVEPIPASDAHRPEDAGKGLSAFASPSGPEPVQTLGA